MLTPDHFSHLFKLFSSWEINGAKDALANRYLKRVLEFVQPDCRFTASSDDHSSLTIARMWTEVPEANTISEFFEGLKRGKASIGGESSTPHTLAWNIYSVGWQWLKATGAVNGSLGVLDRYLLPPEMMRNHSFVRKIWLNPEIMSPRNWAREFALAFIRRELERMQPPSGDMIPPCKLWFSVVDAVTSKYMVKLGNKIVNDLTARNFYDLLSTIGLPVAQYMLVAPFLVSFGKFSPSGS